MSKPDEAAFEEYICDWLVDHGGYAASKTGTAQGTPPDFDPVRGLDTAELFAFIGTTQAAAWDQLRNLYGDPGKAQRGFADRLARELDARGTVDVIRHGVVDLGVTIRLAFFRPASGLTPELVERYGKNRLTVTRQLPYAAGSTRTLDLCLFVNGVPVATAELKNAITGQGVDHAIEQYRTARDPKNPLLRRAVVHFAVDTERVAMTTRLAGKATRFLPFNRGHELGAGNLSNPDGHRSAYLWERVWPRDAWLDLLNRFVHVEPSSKGATAEANVIFPRFHQWDAVLALTAEARERGAGRDYLVQHSAGSGKSNTIAWLAHRLSTLHDAADAKVFDKVVVITDRRILDKQLQDTIYQFEHAHGVVVRIDQNSQQLAEALEGEQARVIITTLQKFPFLTEKIGSLPERTYAVIVDEAHSSQTGESATALKAVLGNRAGEKPDPGELSDPVEDALAAAVAARGRQPNLSFVAFTATPKARTLEMFGRYDPATDRHAPFHLYSMRQAIEEGFIHDVLANYLTYQTYWQIEQATPEDPTYDPGKARAAIARFVSLHPHQLAQKAEVIVEHFRAKVRHRIGGMAKAMVVTASREHAARYKLALETYINDKGYTDVGVLVAFSGSLDIDGADVTESSMNGFPESQTAREFDTGAWHLLVVAEKYQTGFDQPKLYAMYVDKPLTGLAAVQTLSRLNRTYDRAGVRKEGTFVLDFRNDAEDIRAAFEPYYGATVAPPTDPNLLYDTRHALDPFGVVWPDEVERAVALLLARGRIAHDRVHAALTPAIDRFFDLDEDEQDLFRDALNRFIRIYSFLSQVVAFTDTKLERDYLFCRALAAFVVEGGGEAVHPEVALTHLKLEQTFEGSVTLTETQGEVTTIFGGGKLHEPEDEPLSQIIQRLNERFGTDFAAEDRVFYDAVFDKLTRRADIQQAAAANTAENFRLVLEKEAMAGVLDQLGVAENMALAYVDNPDMQADVLAAYLPFVQGRAKVMHQEHCDIVDLLGPDMESTHLEYKATLRTHADGGDVFKPLETASLKTIAAFMNSRSGGTLLLGVDDDGGVRGLESDYVSRSTSAQDPRDWFQQHLANIVAASMGEAAATNVRPHMHHVDGHDLCRVQVDPAAFPVDARVTVQKSGGPKETRTEFYVRVANGTRAINAVEREKYIAGRWGTPLAGGLGGRRVGIDQRLVGQPLRYDLS